MSIVKVIGEKFKLASRWARIGAFLLDVGLLGFCQALVIFGVHIVHPLVDNFFGGFFYGPNHLIF